MFSSISFLWDGQTLSSYKGQPLDLSPTGEGETYENSQEGLLGASVTSFAHQACESRGSPEDALPAARWE